MSPSSFIREHLERLGKQILQEAKSSIAFNDEHGLRILFEGVFEIAQGELFSQQLRHEAQEFIKNAQKSSRNLVRELAKKYPTKS